MDINYEMDDDEIPFLLGCDFLISWYDEDFFEASYRPGQKIQDHTAGIMAKVHQLTMTSLPLVSDGMELYRYNARNQLLEEKRDRFK